MILAGDIGGTKSSLGLFEDAGGHLDMLKEAEYRSGDYDSLGAIVADFLRRERITSLRAACFGVAGPVIGGRAKITNLPWLVETEGLKQLIPAPRVALLNDLQAAGLGALHLGANELRALNDAPGPAQAATIAVIAAGTGLGEGFLFWDGERYHPGASEGGHADYAPRGAVECELLDFLGGASGEHVSYERVLSGAGLEQLYRFYRGRDGSADPEWLAAEVTSGDAPAAIAEAALAGKDRVCAAALERFVSIYGAEAGNLALKVLALGGVFVAGGIAPKILPELKKGGFMRAFTDKGRFASLLAAIPVKVVLNPRAALIGAAYFARDLQR